MITKQIIIYILKFLGFFCIAYFGTIAIEGLASPVNYYSPFINHYMDYPSWLRASLLSGSKLFASLAGFKSVITDVYHIKIVNGKSVQLVYSCLGVGVMSFWLAFVMANTGGWLRKTAWIIGGMICIWLINVTRLGLLLVTINKNQSLPFGLDNHTFFNILAYVAIFVLIYFYDRYTKSSVKRLNTDK